MQSRQLVLPLVLANYMHHKLCQALDVGSGFPPRFPHVSAGVYSGVERSAMRLDLDVSNKSISRQISEDDASRKVNFAYHFLFELNYHCRSLSGLGLRLGYQSPRTGGLETNPETGSRG